MNKEKEQLSYNITTPFSFLLFIALIERPRHSTKAKKITTTRVASYSYLLYFYQFISNLESIVQTYTNIPFTTIITGHISTQAER